MPFISCYIIYYYLCGTTTSCLKLQVNSFVHLVSSIVMCSILCCIQDHLECLCLWFWWHILLCNFLLLLRVILYEIPLFPTLETYLSVVHVLIRIVTRSSAPIAGHFSFALPNMLLLALVTPFFFTITPRLLVIGVRL